MRWVIACNSILMIWGLFLLCRISRTFNHKYGHLNRHYLVVRVVRKGLTRITQLTSWRRIWPYFWWESKMVKRKYSFSEHTKCMSSARQRTLRNWWRSPDGFLFQNTCTSIYLLTSNSSLSPSDSAVGIFPNAPMH